MMIVGPALILGSSWLVLSFGPLHKRVFEEGWALLDTGQCIWFSELKMPAFIGWFSSLILFGVVMLFFGLWLFRSARFYRFDFEREHAA